MGAALPTVVVDPVDTELMTSFDVSFAMIRTLSFGSIVTIGDCERITGCGIDDIVDEFIIGFICVEPTFIVGVDCWPFFTNDSHKRNDNNEIQIVNLNANALFPLKCAILPLVPVC